MADNTKECSDCRSPRSATLLVLNYNVIFKYSLCRLQCASLKSHNIGLLIFVIPLATCNFNIVDQLREQNETLNVGKEEDMKLFALFTALQTELQLQPKITDYYN
jgi:hypothetical protein